MNALDYPGTMMAPARRRVSTALLVVNPASRSAKRALATVLQSLRAANVACELAETNAPAHATVLVRERLLNDPNAFDAVFTLGGDGTAMEVATALAEVPNAPPLGVIAVGTANVLARTIGIPLSPSAAVTALLDADEVPIDLGRVVGGRTFAIGLGVGLDASMIAGTSRLLKQRFGYLAYAWSAFRAGLRLERFRARITVDGVVHTVETSSILVANFGMVLGDLVCFGEDIAHQDGALDVCIYSPRSLLDAARILWRMMFGGVGVDRCVRIIRCRHVVIDTDPPRPTQADGELLGTTPVDIRVEPSALRLLIPNVRVRRWRFRRVRP